MIKAETNGARHSTRPVMQTGLAALAACLVTLCLYTAAGAGERSGGEAGEAYDKGDYQTAIRIWKPLAEQGDAWAQAYLGLMYRYGTGVEKDCAEAARWYRMSAVQGNVGSQINLGIIYAKGCGNVPQDKATAAGFYRMAAYQGIPLAQYRTGLSFLEGWNGNPDNEEAAAWFRLAAYQGYQLAQGKLGFMYAEGLGMPKDTVKAYMWLSLGINGPQPSKSHTAMIEIRNKLTEEMTAEQIAEAEKLVRNWKPKPRS